MTGSIVLIVGITVAVIYGVVRGVANYYLNVAILRHVHKKHPTLWKDWGRNRSAWMILSPTHHIIKEKIPQDKKFQKKIFKMTRATKIATIVTTIIWSILFILIILFFVFDIELNY